MPTYAQLEAEPYWDREIVTPELDELGDELCRRTGRPASAFGAKGNNVHLRGAHRSAEWIAKSIYCTSRTYTFQTGLTADQLRHIAACDWTPGDWGTPANRALMVAITRRLITALRAGELSGVREVIGTLDGHTVHGERADGSRFSADDSHLDHVHLTFDRRRMRDAALMAKVADLITGDDDMGMTDRDAQALIWRVEGLVAGRAAVAGGPTKGEQIVPNIRLVELDAALDAVAASSGMTPDDLAQLRAAAREGALAGATDALTPEILAAVIPDEFAQDVVDLLLDRQAAAARASADVLDPSTPES